MSLLDPETAHEGALGLLRIAENFSPALSIARSLYFPGYFPELSVRMADLQFSNPVGLAAGWDKNAVGGVGLSALGFGFLEMGTVTPWPSKGYPRPRIFKNKSQRWIVNRVGFANDGAAAVAGRLACLPKMASVVGLSLGKMLESPPERLVDEVSLSLELCYPHASFFTLNISSPNTPMGFCMGGGKFLGEALREILGKNRAIAKRLSLGVRPLFVKISPTVSIQDLDEVAGAIESAAGVSLEKGAPAVAAVIVSNSIATPHGGLSGLPLTSMVLRMTAWLFQRWKGSPPIIGVGGILTPQDAWERIKAGASLIQIYSGLVFRGPAFPGEIVRHLSAQVKKEGFSNVMEACGVKSESYDSP